ncbi:MAG TPA: HD domain-containing phosphohydrolase [Gemmatimonadaceae bacterium]|nr:HD domain-containing phosphohydrolase [Gemmatimonadaceae bacterium]
MSTAARFLAAFGQALATMGLYHARHPARARAIALAYHLLQELQDEAVTLEFSLLGDAVLFGAQVLRDLRRWEWAPRLTAAGIQRIEALDVVSEDDFTAFVEEAFARVNGQPAPTAEARYARPVTIRFGMAALATHTEEPDAEPGPQLHTGGAPISLVEEASAVMWIHRETAMHAHVPMAEADTVVRSLGAAMAEHDHSAIPLLELEHFEDYTTTHALNVATLSMALAQAMGLGARDVRAMGVSGLLHDLGKIRIPREILLKPGRLTEEERELMNAHPVEGARILLTDANRMGLAATVAYEHHIRLDGGGYPAVHYARECHVASRIVHVCDVYDALRTTRPYRPSWTVGRTLSYLTRNAGTEFDAELVHAFAAMMRRVEHVPLRADGAPVVRAVETIAAGERELD